MSDLYYTPEISDLFVGYECEIWWNQDMLPDNCWEPVTLWDEETKDFDITDFKSRISKKELRTPYLTREQIEKEGWTYRDAKSYHLFGYDVPQGFHMSFTKDEYIIQGRGLFSQHIKIFDSSDQEGAHCIYEGKCPSINEFRKICKLLGI